MLSKKIHSSFRLVTATAILAALSACGNDLNPRFSSPQAQLPGGTTAPNLSVTVSIPQGASSLGARAFGANPLAAKVGTQVTWVNEDNVAHSVTSNSGAWDSGPIAPGQSFSRTFSQPGNFPYSSTTEGDTGLSGIVQVSSVTPSPYPSSYPSVTPSPTPMPSHSPSPTPTSSPVKKKGEQKHEQKSKQKSQQKSVPSIQKSQQKSY